MRPTRLAPYIAPLGRRAFRLLWIGQTISAAGNALVQIAFVFAILHIGGGIADIGVIAAIQTVVKVAFILAGGVWADRLRRQFVMLTSDTVRALTEAALAVLLITGHCRIWELGLGAAIFGAASAFFGPAATGLIPETVPADELQQANSLMTVSSSFLYIVAPALAGVLVAVFGPGLVFGLDAISFAASAISLFRLVLPPRNLPGRDKFLRDLAGGWHELAIRPWYWINVCAHACCNFAIPAYLVLGPVIAARQLGGAAAWGAIAAANAIGYLAGGLIAMRVRPHRPLVVANLVQILSILPMLALIPPLAAWVIAVAALFSGASFAFLSTIWAATMQQLIPDRVRSRVDSYDWLISLVAMPTGYALVGPIAAQIGNSATLVGAVILIALPLTLIVLVPGVRSVRRVNGQLVAPPLREPPSAPLAQPVEQELR